MSDSGNELETVGDLSDIGRLDPEMGADLELPSLILHIIMELVQFGIIVFVYAVLSFVPQLFILVVNRFFWTKVILEVILLVMGWIFIYYNIQRFYKRGKLAVGTGSIAFIIYVLLGIASLAYSIMYLIWGIIDTFKVQAGYIRTWSIILLVLVFIEGIVIILSVIFIAYYLRRTAFYFLYRGQMGALQRATFAYSVGGNDGCKKYLTKTYDNRQINALVKMARSDTTSFLPKKNLFNWRKNEVVFPTKQAFIV